MPGHLVRLILPFLLLSSGLAFAQERPSCAVMKGLDLPRERESRPDAAQDPV